MNFDSALSSTLHIKTCIALGDGLGIKIFVLEGGLIAIRSEMNWKRTHNNVGLLTNIRNGTTATLDQYLCSYGYSGTQGLDSQDSIE